MVNMRNMVNTVNLDFGLYLAKTCYQRLPKVTKGYQRLPKFIKGNHSGPPRPKAAHGCPHMPRG